MADLNPKQSEIKIVIGDDYSFSETISYETDPAANSHELKLITPECDFIYDSSTSPALAFSSIQDAGATTYTGTLTVTIPADVTAKIPPHRASRFILVDTTSGRITKLNGGVTGIA